MRKRLICFITSLSLIFVFAFSSFSLSSSAYTSSSSFYNTHITVGGSKSFSFSSDGVLLMHSFFKTSTSVQNLLPSERNLDLTYFTSGTWQGIPISELSSDKICDQSDTVGFSQTVSVTFDNKWFIYSVVTCLPCVAGDSFTLKQASSHFAYETSYTSAFSVLPGVSSVKKVYNYQRGTYTDDSISFTSKSDNQYLICVYSADRFTSAGYVATGLSSSNSDSVACDYSNISRIASNTWSSIYTSNFGLSSGSDLSLKLKSDINTWNFSVYEIYTDGTTHSGFDDGSDPDSGGGDSSSDQTEISNNILTNIKNILSLISDLPQKIAEKIGNYFTDLKNSFVTAIENLRDKLLEGIEYLFIPSDNYFLELEEVIKEKFKFFYQIIDLLGSVVLAEVDVPPNNKITLYGEEIVFMDWTLYANYKPLIDRIIIIVSYYFYFQRLIKRIPGVIGGIHS